MDRGAAEWRVASTHKSATISTEGRPSGSSSDLVETRRGVAFAFARQGIYPMDSVAPKVGTQTRPNSRSHLRTSTREKGPNFESKNGPNFGAPKCFFFCPQGALCSNSSAGMFARADKRRHPTSHRHDMAARSAATQGVRATPLDGRAAAQARALPRRLQT